jgi:hypothetical protein
MEPGRSEGLSLSARVPTLKAVGPSMQPGQKASFTLRMLEYLVCLRSQSQKSNFEIGMWNRIPFLVLLSIANLEAAPRHLRFEIAIKKDSEFGRGIESAFSAVLSKAGYTVSLEDFPTRRGLEELKNGRVDGSIGRLGPIATMYQIDSVVRIDVPSLIMTMSIWCEKSKEDLLKVKSPRLATFHGSVIATRLVQAMDEKSAEIIDIPNYHTMLTMMNKGRLDCFLGSYSFMTNQGVKAGDVEHLYRHDLVTSRGYPWINRKYAFLKTFLEKELRAYTFPADWSKKFLNNQTACRKRFDYVCPDGRFFKKEFGLRLDQTP